MSLRGYVDINTDEIPFATLPQHLQIMFSSDEREIYLNGKRPLIKRLKSVGEPSLDRFCEYFKTHDNQIPAEIEDIYSEPRVWFSLVNMLTIHRAIQFCLPKVQEQSFNFKSKRLDAIFNFIGGIKVRGGAVAPRLIEPGKIPRSINTSDKSGLFYELFYYVNGDRILIDKQSNYYFFDLHENVIKTVEIDNFIDDFFREIFAEYDPIF